MKIEHRIEGCIIAPSVLCAREGVKFDVGKWRIFSEVFGLCSVTPLEMARRTGGLCSVTPLTFHPPFGRIHIRDPRGEGILAQTYTVAIHVAQNANVEFCDS